jgi:hypothetical protein
VCVAHSIVKAVGSGRKYNNIVVNAVDSSFVLYHINQCSSLSLLAEVYRDFKVVQ